MALQFELDTLYTQTIPGNIIPTSAFREATKLPMPTPLSELLNTISTMSDWKEWMRETKGTYTGAWPKRFAKLAYNTGLKIEPELLATIGETLKRFTVEGTYHFEITKFMDWIPGDFAEKPNSCWWSSYNSSRKGFNQLDSGYAVLFYPDPEHYKRYKNKRGIGRCWFYNTERYGAIFNAYGVPLSEIATVLSNKFEVDMLKTELYSEKAYLNQGNKNNEEGAGGDTGLGFILGRNLSALRSPIDLGNFQYKMTCHFCERQLREGYTNKQTRQEEEYLYVDICESCMPKLKCCTSCGCYVQKADHKRIYDGDRGSLRDYCLTCLETKPISVCEVHGEHIGRSYKVWHKKACYCHSCLGEGTSVCKCNKCTRITNDFKTVSITNYRFKLCKPCRTELGVELST